MSLRLSELDNLLQRARTIRDEVMHNANTALRVGSLFYDIIMALATINIDELRQIFLSKEEDDATTHKLTMGEAEVTGNASVSGNINVAGNSTVALDSNVGGLQTVKELDVTGDPNVQNETASGASSHMRTVVFGNYMSSVVGSANGAIIKEDGEAQFRSVSISGSLSVPEIRFNRADVYIGIGLRSDGGGIIEKVYVDRLNGVVQPSGRASLKLENGEAGAIDIDDKCLGFWHNVMYPYSGDANASASRDDHNGNYVLRGFQSVYFVITGIYANEYDFLNDENLITDREKIRGTCKYFRYELRPISDDWTTQLHPHDEMHFGMIANATNTDRQDLVITTPTYEIMLEKLTDWTWDFTLNCVEARGKLDGFSMRTVDENGMEYTQQFEGNAVVMGNVYVYGGINMFGRSEKINLLAAALRIEFTGMNGEPITNFVYADDVDVILEAHIMYGTVDVTTDALAALGSVVGWKRISTDASDDPEDNTWQPTVVDASGNTITAADEGYAACRHRIRLLHGLNKARQDLSSRWEQQLWCKFNASFIIPDGSRTYSLNENIDFGI